MTTTPKPAGRMSTKRATEKAAARTRRETYRVSTEPVKVRLPFPPALNHYYRTAVVAKHAQTYISKDGKAYRLAVIAAWSEVRMAFKGHLAIRIDAVFPDARKRDLDGLLKSLLDSLEHAGAYADDSQVKLLIVQHSHTEKPGWVDIVLGPRPDSERQGTLFETTW